MLGLMVLGPVQASTPDVDLIRCARLTEAPARLACFDALAAQASARAAAGATASAAPVAATAATTPPGATVPAPPVAPAQDPRVASFGMPASATGQLEAIESRLEGRFEGWEPGGRLRLANGQVWQISDGSRYYAPRPLDTPVTRVRRGVLGSHFLEIDGVQVSPRVRRVQ